MRTHGRRFLTEFIHKRVREAETGFKEYAILKKEWEGNMGTLPPSNGPIS